MKETKLLPPPMVVRMAWALTGDFVSEPESKSIASDTIAILKDLRDKAEKADTKEREYVDGVFALIEATRRTLDTIYKGRQLNFKENEELRSVKLEKIKDAVEFGKSAKDYLKSLPTMTVTSGIGVITLNQLIASLPDWALWSIGLGAAGAGYFINLGIVRWSKSMTQDEYIKADYDRNMYYEQYLVRLRTTLINLYYDVDRLHKKSFGERYQLERSESAASIVDGVLAGAMPTMCQFVEKHLKGGKITPELWTRCETGGESAKECKYWGK
jgi:hypothetical protein